MVPLGEVADINPQQPKIDPGDTVSFVGMAQLDAITAQTGPGEPRRFADVSKGYTVFQDRDVLLAKITPCFENNKIGQATLGQKVGVGSTEFHVIRPGGQLIDRYVLHFLRQAQIRSQGELRMTGSAGQRRVPVAFLQTLPIPLHPLDEQRRIAAILDHADALRAKRRQVISHLDDLAQAIFADVFGRCSGSVPRWPTVLLRDVIAQGPQNGLYKPASAYGTGVPIVRIDSFQDGARAIVNSLKRVRVSTDEAEKFSLANGDLLINRVNARSHLGKSTVVEGLNETTVFESNMMRIRLDTSAALPTFVGAAFQTPHLKYQIQHAAKDAVNQSSINQKDIESLELPLPPIEHQRLLLARRRLVEASADTARRSLTGLDTLFASLQSRAFRGEL